MNRRLFILKICFFCMWTIFCFFYGKDIPFSEQKYLYEALRNMSAIIFGIMGVWIGILHPRLLKESNAQDSLNNSKISDSRHLIPPMIYAAVSLCVIVMIVILKPIAMQFNFILTHYKIFRAMSFTIVGGLGVLLIWALIISFVPYVSIMIAKEREKARSKKIDTLAGK